MSEKPDCYKCIHRGTVPGDAHSCCNYPGNNTGIFDMFNQPANNAEKLNIRANPHGVKNGWFMWPVNFDPVWLENCDGFESKEKNEPQESGQFQYTFSLSFDLGNAVDEVKEIETSMNSTLASFGIRERLSIRSNGLQLKIKSNRELTAQEESELKKIIEEELSCDRLGTVKVESIRKSRSQSCSQSKSR